MAFSGTTEKCKACDKTVHFIDLLSADGISYHKTCFKCSHCNGLLVMSSYCSMEGVLYCKPHFEQLFKETGCYAKKLQTGKSDKPNGLARAPSRVASFFSGTQDKCGVCGKTAYPLEKVTVEGENYHKSCFRCSHGGCFLTPSSYAALDGILYCKPHFAQLFKEKGSYSHLTKQASLKKNSAGALLEGKSEAESEPESESESKPEDEPKPEAEAEEQSDQPVAQDQY
ncbi:LIM domain-containing protein WLIM2b-like isoform X1 [Durio zibethinus]|uniref:LIM domain-containing protein WLIM2b-like isoform X1 n=1 Tax=Durio zibethinus TaxID=66656 RepID=A0A6P6B7B7_DURZI|nr:LIM domain-containing protein WLIM2b-like isoform X1 [Durio zibethinus]